MRRDGRGSRGGGRGGRGICALLAVLAVLVLLPAGAAEPVRRFDNGLALTPPMGWNDYNAFGLEVTEDLIRRTADRMVSSGLRDAGYVYVNVDDGWMAATRDASGDLRADPDRFPHGIKALADYVHGLGLRLGIYEDAGTRTCGGYPGSLGFEELDARQFASWGVDYLKYDTCYDGSVPARQRYGAMRDALAATGRPIVYSICNWGAERVWAWGSGYGNLWRTTTDIQPTFASFLSVFHATVTLAGYAGPGGWNDPDMLEVGNGMTAAEDRAELSLWAMMAAPLIAGNDLTTAGDAVLADLGNRDVIAVDQDPLGRPATLVSAHDGLDVLTRPLANGDVAVLLFNETARAATITATVPGTQSIRDLWNGTTVAAMTALVPAHGVAMYRVGTSG
ncbi:glycoside hydrolase family 27 protein [Dactylosporangium sp. NPDC051541]|uniref:glycoside hydrolase family 27 protein n=1 Tax=Dactylosporangium sp. NPDC051541 TaxID=3363977 RepID=UPI0037BC066B